MEELPPFDVVARLRPVDIVAPDLVETGLDAPGAASATPCPQPAPSYAAEVTLGSGPVRLWWASGAVTLAGEYDAGRVTLVVDDGRETTRHRPRIPVRAAGEPDRFAVAVTGTHLTAFTHADGAWTARARVDLRQRVDTRDEAWLRGLSVGHDGEVRDLRAGAFGQLGLRDPRLVSHADGTPYTRAGRLLLTATSAGPGFFDTAHTSVWELDPATYGLTHLSDLFFRRGDRPGVYADHATHLMREDDGWLVATSTWGDFDPALDDAAVGVTLARSDDDLLRGRHLLDTEPLRLPTDGHASVGVWDPHLVRVDDGWLVGYVSARRFFDFFPVVATGPTLDALALRAAATERRATEGTTLMRVGEDWCVLASDGRDNPRAHRAGYPVFDLDLRQTGTLEAEYGSNIPWPTLAQVSAAGDPAWLMISFDGEEYGGRLVGYGSHGDLVIARSRPAR
jgi:hypothetical protein